MADQLPSKDKVRRFRQRADKGDVIESDWGEFVLYADFQVVYDSHKWLYREKQRLETALTGISTCSTCEACRGAAKRALGGATGEKR